MLDGLDLKQLATQHCAQMYNVIQGLGTSAAKGAPIGHRYPTMQFTVKQFFFRFCCLKV